MKQGAEDAEGEISVHRGDELVVYYVQLMNVTGNAQKNIRVLGTLEDITEEKQTEIRLKKGEQIRSAVLSDAIEFFEVNLNKDCTMRDGVIKESPYTYTQIIEKFAELRVCEEYQEKVLETFSIRNLRHMYEIGVHDVSLEYLRKPEYGEPFWASCEAHLEKDVATDDIVALSVVRDIHDQKVRQIQLENQAILDPLTKAYNRNAGISKISEILEKYPDTSNALVFIDLDNFKGVNDTLGHFVGDTVLVDVVKIIKQHVRQKDIVCRMGGDEFLIFLVDIPREVIHRNIKKLLEKLNLTYERDGISESISASIGIAVTPEDGTDFQTLYEKADTTLYDVKKSSKNNFKFYEGN